MRVIQLASTFLPRMGGAEIVVHNLAMQQLSHGDRPFVITWWGLWANVARKLPYPVYPLFPRTYTHKDRSNWMAGTGTRWKMEWQIMLYQRFLRADIWHVHMAYPAGMLAVPILKKMGCRIVTTCHGDDIIIEPDLHFDIRLNEFLNQEICNSLKLSDAVTAISRRMHDAYRTIGIPEERIVDIWNGTDTVRIQQMGVNRSAIRAQWGIPDYAKVLLTVARVHKQKGHDYIPVIMEKLLSLQENIYWILMGTGTRQFRNQLSPSLKARIIAIEQDLEEGGDPSKWAKMPPDNVIEWLKSADVFVLPSRFEGMPLVLLEAMAAGMPVVANRVSGCDDLIQHGMNGFLCAVGNTQAMVDHIQLLCTDSALHAEVSKTAVEKVSRYDWSCINRSYRQVYNRLIG